MDAFLNAEIIASFLTLTALEIVLGIDNIIFLALISSRLPHHQQALARKIGLIMALVGRVGFLFSITWIMRLKDPIFTLQGFEASWRDIILISGGLFLLYNATTEIHATLEGHSEDTSRMKRITFTSAIIQIAILDVVFALDSMITAVGLSDILWIMIAANVVAMGVMMYAATPVSQFIEKHPSLKMLALAFLLMVGVALVADGTHFHIPRNYIYFCLGFSAFTEFLNILAHTKKEKRSRHGR